MKIVFTLFFIAYACSIFGQEPPPHSVGIGTTNPHASALLELSSSSKGLLIPRLTTMQRVTIPGPAQGLLVYDVDTNGYWWYDGSGWKAIPSATPESKARTIFIAGAGLGHDDPYVSPHSWGLRVQANGASGLVVPRPPDWDKAYPFTVTLYFAIPAVYNFYYYRWQLLAGTVDIHTGEFAPPGFENEIGQGSYVDGQLQLVSPPAYPLPMVAMSQSWTSTYSAEYSTWTIGSPHPYFNFSNDPLWNFLFYRGFYRDNGETYPGDLIITGVTISYTAL